METAGKYRARLRLTRPSALTLSQGLPPVLPAGRPIATDFRPYLTGVAWTSGPFRLEGYVPQRQAVFRSNPLYRTHGRPRLNKLTSLYLNAGERISAAASGTTNATSGYNVYDLAALRAHAVRYRLVMHPSALVRGLVFNVHDPSYQGQPNPVRDVRVRQALPLAFNRLMISRDTLGLDQASAAEYVARSPFFVSTVAREADVPDTVGGSWNPVIRRFVSYGPHALADAKTLLAHAGHAGGLKIDIVAPAGQEFALLQRAWSPLKVTLRRMEPYAGCCLQWPWSAGQFEISLDSWQAGVDHQELHDYLASNRIHRLKAEFVNPKDLNASGVRDPLIDAAFARGGRTFDPKIRTANYDRIQQRVIKQAYWAPLYYAPNILTIDRHAAGIRNTTYLPPDFAWTSFNWRYKP